MSCTPCDQTDRSDSAAGCHGGHGSCGSCGTAVAHDVESIVGTASDLQGLLLHALTGIAQYDVRARTLKVGDDAAAALVVRGMAATLAEAEAEFADEAAGGFADEAAGGFSGTGESGESGETGPGPRLEQLIREAAKVRDRVKAGYEVAAVARGLVPADYCERPEEPDTRTGTQSGGCGSGGCGCGKKKAGRRSVHPSFLIPDAGSPAAFVPAADLDALMLQAAHVAVRAAADDADVDVTIAGMRALALHGLKGVCANAHRAAVVGVSDPAVFLAIETTLDYLAGNPDDIEQLRRRVLALGRLNLRALELVDEAKVRGAAADLREPQVAIAGDAGTATDAFAVIRSALALDRRPTDPPLSFVVSWSGERDLAVVLTLLALGLGTVTLASAASAFLPDGAVAVLAERFGVRPV